LKLLWSSLRFSIIIDIECLICRKAGQAFCILYSVYRAGVNSILSGLNGQLQRGKMMRKKLITLLIGIAALAVTGRTNVKAVDYETALALQEAATKNYYQMLEAQTSAAAANQNALTKAQQAQLNAIEAQQKAAADALAAQQAALASAQQSQLEAANQIAAASLVTPQLDVICDTNCAEQNAMLYGKSVPDFVLVDISEQRAIFYKNGQRVLGDNCVTGDAKRKHNTTVGIHQIIFMDTNRTLHGSYGEAFVKYWMRFTKDGQGLHDAGWRNNFGNQIYISNGSHGCVNLPRSTAQTIFNNAYVGMFVIVEN